VGERGFIFKDGLVNYKRIVILLAALAAVIGLGLPMMVNSQGPAPLSNFIVTTAQEIPAAAQFVPTLIPPQKSSISGLQDELAQLVAARQAGDQTKLSAYVQDRNVDLANNRVRVILEMDVSPDAHPADGPRIETVQLPDGKTAQIQHAPAIVIRPALAQAIAATGAVYETAYQNWVQVTAPIEALEALTKISGVRYVRLPYPAAPSELPPGKTKNLSPLVGAQTSQGVNLTNTNTWHSAGYIGSGVNLAVFDFGFTGWATRQVTGDLPAGAVLKDFSTSYSFSPDTPNMVHGTACAEITYDMAPGATHYLYAFGTEVEFGNAVNDLLNNVSGTKVVSMSIGWVNAGPYDGTGPINTIVDNAKNAGIFWANSAGNNQRAHWSGTAVQYSNGDYLTFGAGIVQGIGPTPGNLWNISSGTTLRIFLEWNDWNAARTGNQNFIDYDIFLYRWTGSSWVYVTRTNGNQCRYDTVPPTEALIYTVPSGGPYNYAIGIQRWDGSGACPNNFGSWMQLHTFNSFRNAQGAANSFWYVNQCNSLLIPSDGDSSVTVGATFWNEDSTSPLYGLETFSSLGPRNAAGGGNPGTTVNKPDVVAPDGVSGETYGANDGTNFANYGGGFFGTSAAAPHVAGMAAVMWSREPTMTLDQVAGSLKSQALYKADGGACGGNNLLNLQTDAPESATSNNRYGYGRISLRQPTAVELSSVRAKLTRANKVRVVWQSANELNLKGFNIWRADSKQGEFKKLNAALVTAKNSGNPIGAKYKFGDKRVKSAKTYFYKIEIVHADGSSAWSDVKRIQVP